jgi:predicted metal-dependent phosphoesterase TrpH
MRVDLHFHFRRRKEDRLPRLAAMLKEAEAAGIGGMALLDHDWFPTDEVMAFARESAPSITFWRACELTIFDEARGHKDHVVVASDAPLDLAVSGGLSTKDIGLLVKALEGRNDVLTMLAHPFRRRHALSFDLHQFRPTLIDAIGRSANQEALRSVTRLAAAWGMGLACASDSHRRGDVGRHYMDFIGAPKTIRELALECCLSRYRLVAAGK